MGIIVWAVYTPYSKIGPPPDTHLHSWADCFYWCITGRAYVCKGGNVILRMRHILKTQSKQPAVSAAFEKSFMILGTNEWTACRQWFQTHSTTNWLCWAMAEKQLEKAWLHNEAHEKKWRTSGMGIKSCSRISELWSYCVITEPAD